MSTLEVRTGTAADLPGIHLAGARAFGDEAGPERIAEIDRLIPPARYVLGLDAGTVVGVTAVMPLRMTVPGRAQVRAAGIADVSVAATHRRRGILRQILSAQHHGLVEEGFALAALTASEGTIYGRFGYGPATVYQRVEIDRQHAAFRPGAPDPGGVRQTTAEQARGLLPAVHARWQSRTPGALHRSGAWWDWQLSDRPAERRGASALQFLVHPDGYATFRRAEGPRGRQARVVELVAATEDAHAALWRVLLGLDLVPTVVAELSPDDPLPFLLTDTRAARVTGARDGVWVRLLDVGAALAQRRYATELDVVIDVADGFLGRGGRFRLRGGPEGAECTRTDASADVHTDVSTLGSLHLGGHRVRTLHRAGLVGVHDPAVLDRLDLALVTDRAPVHGTDF
ncbi:GNAT family N-acetyltransferase [Rhodococcus antarcticus]|uniref:GNAT family N-acetyltransferase n=1 Tax=Rhodococcus antarcticus TaxID=2987751 RepID=A0ABY6NY03_9NOCA|nr:GNAT family N-acetyltransferase [Rhodococcus antarcticus]UZJ24256.1 GNAT family N-acetyltransferase [Rhodococcus antarcticus]